MAKRYGNIYSPRGLRPYQYKTPRRPQEGNVNRMPRVSETETLSKMVQGQPASDIEERFARALSRRQYAYAFRQVINVPFQIPGQKNEVDFIVFEQGTWPIEIDGEFTHKTSEQRAHDSTRDAILDEHLGQWGWQRIQRIPGEDLEDQEMANRKVDEIF